MCGYYGCDCSYNFFPSEFVIGVQGCYWFLRVLIVSYNFMEFVYHRWSPLVESSAPICTKMKAETLVRIPVLKYVSSFFSFKMMLAVCYTQLLLLWGLLTPYLFCSFCQMRFLNLLRWSESHKYWFMDIEPSLILGINPFLVWWMIFLDMMSYSVHYYFWR